MRGGTTVNVPFGGEVLASSSALLSGTVSPESWGSPNGAKSVVVDVKSPDF